MSLLYCLSSVNTACVLLPPVPADTIKWLTTIVAEVFSAVIDTLISVAVAIFKHVWHF